MKRVLLVDDSETQLMLAQAALAPLKCEIITARNGLEAVERALACKPHLIFMDVEMPELNGFEACKRMRAMLADSPPILLVTTRSCAAHVRQGFECGCTGYLTKPVATTELLYKARLHLGI